MKRSVIALLMIALFLTGSVFAQDDARLLRFPAVYNDMLVFTYAGDLYQVSSAGGEARKLTNHEGVEIFARFSHDGKYIAFTGQYDGNTEVYLMNPKGGVPKRLTYTATLGRDDISDRMGPNNIVMAWKHDNKTIAYRSRRISYNSFNGQLFYASVNGGIPEQVPVPRTGFCSFNADDSKMAYNRIFREFRTWKRYRGGMADDVWIFDFKTKTIENITNNPAQDIIPMWKGDKIYFLSDRDDLKRMNLYVYDLNTKETKRLTNFTDFDIKFPSLGNKAIAFENGGYIYLFDLAAQKAEKVNISIHEDFSSGRTELKEVGKNVTNYEISPDGKRALFGARGDVFTVPAKEGPTRNLTNTPGVHERNSKWSPDGKYIAYVSDRSGEDEIYMISQDGMGKEIRITNGGETYKFNIYWSPDSKKILWGDRRNRLRYVDIDLKKITEVSYSAAGEFHDYAWSPDSKWVTFTKQTNESMNKIWLYSLEKKKEYPVTEGWYSSFSPRFSADGKYLFFISNRSFNPTYGWTEFNTVYRFMSRIYFVTLSKKTPSPFKPKSDEVAIKKEEPKKAEKKKTAKKDDKKKPAPKKEGVTITVDIDGINDRIIALPVQAAGYRSPLCVGNNVYYLRNGRRDARTVMLMYDLKAQKEKELGNVNGYEVSADNKKMLVSQNRSYGIIPLPKGKISLKKKLNLNDMEMTLDRHAEWNQIFDECWRQMREYFYVENMHGVDWKAMHDRYKPLVKHVNHRIDLTYVIGEMIGELDIGHAYVGGGDYPHPKRIRTGLLGAELERDASGYYKIDKILKGENWNGRLRSPLTAIGVGAKTGDFILAVNGVSTKNMTDIYKALVNTAGKQVTLKINGAASETGARDVTVVPIADESGLYYYNWVRGNIEKVNKATNGRVGYIHVPDMGANGLNQFAKLFYPQLSKEALIIDVRGNGGGNVSPMLIERLRRELAFMGNMRGNEPTTDPGQMQFGPKVCLMDEFSASDGDIFPYRFKIHKMGKLVGKRSWGGVTGIRGSLPLLDGGTMNRPEFGMISADGKKWPVEGHGVDPDIVVDNDPAKEFAGIDQQLTKAIEVALDELKTWNKKLPKKLPPLPVK